MRHEDLAIVDKGIFPRHVLVATLEATVQVANAASAWLDEHIADVGEELERAVVVEDGNSRQHAFFQNKVDEFVIVRKAWLIDRCTWEYKREDTCPWNGEAVILYAHGCDALNVLLVEIVVLNGYPVWRLAWDVEAGNIIVGWCSTLVGDSTLNLDCCCSNTEHKVGREIVTALGNQRLGRR